MPQSVVGLLPSIFGLATGGLGLGGQMAGSKQQKKILDQQQAEQAQAFQNLQQQYQKWNQMTPGQVSQQLSQLTQPISANQATAVTNAVSPALANMGLGQSAGQLAESMAPQLAQFQGQNQQLAAQMLGLMSQLPASIAGAEAGTPQSMGQFLQPQGQGGASSMFQSNLATLLGKLPGPSMRQPGYQGGAWNSGSIDWSQVPWATSPTPMQGGGTTGFTVNLPNPGGINWGGNFGA